MPIVVALLLLGGGVLAWQRSSDGGATAAPAAGGTQRAGDSDASPTADATADSQASSSQSSSSQSSSSESSSADPAESDSSASASSSANSGSSGSGDAAAQELLDGCRERVRARDDVITAAATGVGHWSEHVQAQTDANHGKISRAKMNAIFKRTRLTGPDDVQAYHRSVRAASEHKGSCQAPADTPESVKADLERCDQRSQAQQPVVAAADKGMQDWSSHLAAMRRSRMGHVHDAQGVWIRAWRAAPPHIKTFKHARKSFKAPDC